MHRNQDYNKSFDFYWLRDFSVILKIWLFFFFFFFNLTTDFENRQQVQCKVQAYTSISFRLIFNEKKKKSNLAYFWVLCTNLDSRENIIDRGAKKKKKKKT